MEDTVRKQLFFSSRRYGRFSLHSGRYDACAIRLNIAFFHVFWFPTDGIPIRQRAFFGRQTGRPLGRRPARPLDLLPPGRPCGWPPPGAFGHRLRLNYTLILDPQTFVSGEGKNRLTTTANGSACTRSFAPMCSTVSSFAVWRSLRLPTHTHTH